MSGLRLGFARAKSADTLQCWNSARAAEADDRSSLQISLEAHVSDQAATYI
jgi:hypothetical protein